LRIVAAPRSIGVRKALSAGVVLAAVLLALGVAGCGGDEDGSGSGDTTAVSAGNERLTPAQWSAYQASVADFADARKGAQEKLDTCPRSGTGDLDLLDECAGTSLDDLQAAAITLGETLAGFIGTVTGACAGSLNSFTQYATPFVASVEQLQQTLADDNVAGLANSISSVETALAGGTEERADFERDCSPL